MTTAYVIYNEDDIDHGLIAWAATRAEAEAFVGIYNLNRVDDRAGILDVESVAALALGQIAAPVAAPGTDPQKVFVVMTRRGSLLGVYLSETAAYGAIEDAALKNIADVTEIEIGAPIQG